MYYFLNSGFVAFLIIIGFVYLFYKLSKLSDRVGELEKGRRVETLPAPSAQYIGGSVMPSVAPSPAPAPVPAPLPQPTETQEEASARWLGWVGAIMLILGISFFLKYAFDNNWVGPIGQVAIGIIAGLVLVTLGQKFREKYLKYSDLLFGAGISILYLAIYAGFAFFDPVVIPQTLAFILMVLVTMLSMVIAIMGGTINIAVLGVLGGFLTPVLLSTGSNEIVTLSLYMLVLNLGVLGVSWFKKWIQLSYLAFLGTVLLFGGWMGRWYWTNPDGQLWITFFFLTLFFAVFLANSIVHHFSRQENSTKGDLVLLVLNAMGYFAVTYTILAPKYDEVLGFFALVLAVIYLCVAYVTYASSKHDRILNLTLPGIAVVFLSLAVPLQLSGYFITIAWLTEALVLVYVGLMIKEKPIQIFGIIVLVLGALSLLEEVTEIRSLSTYGSAPVELMPVMNMAFFLLALGIATLYGFAYLYAKLQNTEDGWKKFAGVFLVLANVLTIFTISSEVTYQYSFEVNKIERAAQAEVQKRETYQGGAVNQDDYYREYESRYAETYKLTKAQWNERNTVVSILWAIYAVLLLVIGFAGRIRAIRLLGLGLFFVTALKVLAEVWALGEIYRIVSTLVFGVIALGAAFLYTKHRDKIKEIIYD